MILNKKNRGQAGLVVVLLALAIVSFVVVYKMKSGENKNFQNAVENPSAQIQQFKNEVGAIEDEQNKRQAAPSDPD